MSTLFTSVCTLLPISYPLLSFSKIERLGVYRTSRLREESVLFGTYFRTSLPKSRKDSEGVSRTDSETTQCRPVKGLTLKEM